MISPLSHGLLQWAIAQSGGDMGPAHTREGMAVLRDAEKSGVAFASALGAQSVSELRKIPAEKIIELKFDGLPEIPHSNAALPIVDGYVIPDDTYTLYSAGKQAGVPCCSGYNADEGAYTMIVSSHGFVPVKYVERSFATEYGDPRSISGALAGDTGVGVRKIAVASLGGDDFWLADVVLGVRPRPDVAQESLLLPLHDTERWWPRCGAAVFVSAFIWRSVA